MFGDFSVNEIELLKGYGALSHNYQKDFKEYLRYLLCRQYRREVMIAVFHNQLVHNLSHSLLHLVERDDFDIEQIEKRLYQLNELYFGIFEKVHNKYSELVDELDSNELVKDFGKTSFENIRRALRSDNRILIRMEVVEFLEGYNKLARSKDARKIVAV